MKYTWMECGKMYIATDTDPSGRQLIWLNENLKNNLRLYEQLENRYQWHYVEDGDLPEITDFDSGDSSIVECAHVTFGQPEVTHGYYCKYLNTWNDSLRGYMDIEVYAWRSLPDPPPLKKGDG